MIGRGNGWLSGWLTDWVSGWLGWAVFFVWRLWKEKKGKLVIILTVKSFIEFFLLPSLFFPFPCPLAFPTLLRLTGLLFLPAQVEAD